MSITFLDVFDTLLTIDLESSSLLILNILAIVLSRPSDPSISYWLFLWDDSYLNSTVFLAEVSTGSEVLIRPALILLPELLERDSLPFLDFYFLEAEVAAVLTYFCLWGTLLGVYIVYTIFLFEAIELVESYFCFFSLDFSSYFLSYKIYCYFRFIYSSYFLFISACIFYYLYFIICYYSYCDIFFYYCCLISSTNFFVYY